MIPISTDLGDIGISPGNDLGGCMSPENDHFLPSRFGIPGDDLGDPMHSVLMNASSIDPKIMDRLSIIEHDQVRAMYETMWNDWKSSNILGDSFNATDLVSYHEMSLSVDNYIRGGDIRNWWKLYDYFRSSHEYLKFDNEDEDGICDILAIDMLQRIRGIQ